MTTQLILVSHALTQWNIEGRIQGHTDVPLNHEGKNMAQCLAKRLAKETIHGIYTSDLKRAYQTAEPVAEQKSLSIIQEIGLREGRSLNQELSSAYPTLPFHKEVETEADLYLRMRGALSNIAKHHDNQTILVVSHGGALEFFIKYLLEKDTSPSIKYQGIRMALNRLQYKEGQWTIIHLNENEFLNLK